MPSRKGRCWPLRLEGPSFLMIQESKMENVSIFFFSVRGGLHLIFTLPLFPPRSGGVISIWNTLVFSVSMCSIRENVVLWSCTHLPTRKIISVLNVYAPTLVPAHRELLV